MRSIRMVGLLCLLGPALSACVAVAVPVVVGGVAARHTIRAKGAVDSPAPAASAKLQARGSTTPASVAASPGAPVTATPPTPVEQLPTDLSKVQAGRFYKGELPAPRAAADPGPPTTSLATVPASGERETGWAALGHYVAGNMAPDHGVLLAPGGAPGSPWLPCAGKPTAVLASAAVITAAANNEADRSWLDALHTLGIKLIVFGPVGMKPARLGSAFAAGDDLFTVASPVDLPAIRARAAARHCVIALAGQGGADFPNGYTPDTTPPAYRDRWGAGWFLFPPR